MKSKNKIQVGDLVRSCYGKAMGYKNRYEKRHDEERQLGFVVSLEGTQGIRKPEYSWNVEWLNSPLTEEEVFLERYLEKIE